MFIVWVKIQWVSCLLEFEKKWSLLRRLQINAQFDKVFSSSIMTNNLFECICMWTAKWKQSEAFFSQFRKIFAIATGTTTSRAIGPYSAAPLHSSVAQDTHEVNSPALQCSSAAAWFSTHNRFTDWPPDLEFLLKQSKEINCTFQLDDSVNKNV